ncbi:MAG: hypothetical protein H7328_00980 [Bdellovibrio sp.]|nr:hypothetical protein [Bdellovibrio sp.]
MKMYSNKTLLISVSLLLALTSCGKSKDLHTDSGAASPAPTAEPAKTPAKTPEKTPAAPKAATPAPVTPGESTPGTLPGAATPFPGQAQGPFQNENSIEQNESLPPLPVSPFQNQGAQTNVLNPPLSNVKQNEGRAYQVDFTKQVAVKTGGQTKDLFYTSAGRDGLMEEFKAYALKVAKEQQTTNASLAKAVITAKLARHTSSGEVTITMNFDEGGTVKTYKLKASTAGDQMNLSVNRASTTGEMEFQGGFLKCLDADGGCENAYAKMKFSGAYTRVIFRNSLADMHFQYEENVVNNPSFNLWKSYVLNSATGAATSATFDTLQMSSYEVVNGRAGMGALLTTNDKEMIALSIPLVVSGTGSVVDSPVAKLADLTLNYDLSSQANSYSQNLSKKISAVKLTYNNGLGQLKLNISLGAPAAASIWMVASRVQKPIMSLEQIRLFESKTKSF